jgi:hypothetical protein
MKAIPTVYKGRKYRSRLEAHWAAFFDLLGWRAEYEPADFHGWIPDFALLESETVYVEVKPFSKFPQEIEETIRKVSNSGCDKEILIVGITVPIQDRFIGWLREYTDNNGSKLKQENWLWSGAPLGIWRGTETETTSGRISVNNPNNVIGFCHSVGRFVDRISGFYDGGCYGQGELDLSIVERLWAQAGNESQWNP